MRFMARQVPIILLLSACAAFAADLVPLQTQRVNFRVVYKDGDVDHMLVKYSAYAINQSHNTGSASKGITHLQDTRRCVMTMSSWVQRDICIRSRAAGESCRGEYTKVFNDGRAGGTQGQNFFTGNFNVKTCGDIRGTIDSNFASLKDNVMESLDQVIIRDLDPLFEMLAAKEDVMRVERE